MKFDLSVWQINNSSYNSSGIFFFIHRRGFNPERSTLSFNDLFLLPNGFTIPEVTLLWGSRLGPM